MATRLPLRHMDGGPCRCLLDRVMATGTRVGCAIESPVARGCESATRSTGTIGSPGHRLLFAPPCRCTGTGGSRIHRAHDCLLCSPDHLTACHDRLRCRRHAHCSWWHCARHGRVREGRELMRRMLSAARSQIVQTQHEGDRRSTFGHSGLVQWSHKM
jgi:hypothetical protein